MAARKGHLHHKAKLTADQVLEARARYAAGGISSLALSAEYGVDSSTMYAAIKGITWAWLDKDKESA